MENKGVVRKSDHEITPVQQMLSSCAGAMVTSLMVTPLDVVKVRLQSQAKVAPRKNKCYLYCHGYIEDLCCQLHANKPVRFSQALAGQPGTLRTFYNIAKYEGITTLWSGLPTTLMMAVPSTVIYFTLYDQTRSRLMALCNVAKPPLWIPVVAGVVARTIGVTVISPLEMIRTKMQSQQMRYSQISAAIRNLVQQRGILALWHGIGPTYWRDVPFSALYWCCYELLKKQYQQETPTWGFSFAAGATSGTVAAVATLPFDVVKTHLQVELGGEKSLSRGSTFILLKQLYKKNGIKSLFVGIVPRVVKVAPACAIMISTYEHGKQFFRDYNESKSK